MTVDQLGMTWSPLPGQLVRWLDGGNRLGVVEDAKPRQIRVRLDGGEIRIFTPEATLERVTFPVGAELVVEGEDVTGTVERTRQLDDRWLYDVRLAGGRVVVVPEDSVRPAVITDPIRRLRTGQLDDTRAVNLRLAATRLAFAHRYDELAALSNSRVEIKAHQVSVVHRVASTYPHRFLLADEVGLGKTIEAGLIIKELKARGMAERVLVLAPSGLVTQWQYELRTKFNEVFSRYESAIVRHFQDQRPTENPWTAVDNVVVSTSYASYDDDRMREIVLAGWDLVVIDEAHHARRTAQRATRLFKLAEMLNDPDLGGARSCLLLTATPMQLDRHELYSLVELLDPALFRDYEDFTAHSDELAGLNRTAEGLRDWAGLSERARDIVAKEVRRWTGTTESSVRAALASVGGRADLSEAVGRRHRLSEVMVRNRKALIGGFASRTAAIWTVELTPPEREAYDGIAQYVRRGYARSQATGNHILGFLMTTYQQIATSSFHALQQSLIRRIGRLEQRLKAPRTVSERMVEDLDDLEERPVADALESASGAVATASRDAVLQEIKELERLVDLIDNIELDSKAATLVRHLEELQSVDPDVKVLLFTHYLDTQQHLEGLIPEPWSVNLFYGGLKPQEKDAAVTRFREGTGPQLLISTEAGGEGRNFQFCHIVVNYDLPWNPMKVEQRIGRVDRIGQRSKTVNIFNLATLQTVEERVVDVLTNRIKLFEDTVGGLDPILGEVENDLRKILALADEEAEREIRRFEAQLENRVHAAREAERKRQDLIMDTRSFQRDEVDRLLRDRAEVTNDDLRAFILSALDLMRCTIRKVEKVRGAYEIDFSHDVEERFPRYVRDGRTRVVTFDPSVAREHEEFEFLAFGHELVDGLVTQAQHVDSGAITSRRTLFTDEQPAASGWLFTFAVELDGVVSARELVTVFVHHDGRQDRELASWLMDRASRLGREDFGDDFIPDRDNSYDSAADAAEMFALQRMEERKRELSPTNAERLELERRKLDDFYRYKSEAAEKKLVHAESVFERVSTSDDPTVQKIIPVWAKRVEDARRILERLDGDRRRRLGELADREALLARFERLTASFVEILPDLGVLLRRASGTDIPKGEVSAFLMACRHSSADELATYLPKVKERRRLLGALAQKKRFDSKIADRCAAALEAVLGDVHALSDMERFLVRGAVDHFLHLEDGRHDLKDPAGFHDDARIVDAVTLALGREELRVLPPVQPSA